MSYPISAKLFPDLQKYFAKFLKTNEVDRYEIPIPGDIYSEHFQNCRSFIRLLFDDDWSFPNYTHCYKKIENWEDWPISIRDRLLIYPHSNYYLPCCDSTNFNMLYEICDSTSSEFLNYINHNFTDCCNDSTSAENVFNLQNDDFTLLNALNIYRCDSTSIQIINQVNNQQPKLFQLPGSNIWFLTIDFNFLQTSLSKLIFLYLNLKINKDYNFYIWENNNYLASNLLEELYEIYVIDNIFQYIVSIGPDYVEQ